MKTCTECKRPAANGIKKCRGCGHVYTDRYGFIDDKVVPPVHKPQKPRKSRDPLISDDPEKLFVSTIKFNK